MPIQTSCPNCQAVFRLPEEMAGKKVKCQKCAHVFVIAKPEEPAPPPPLVIPNLKLDDAPAAQPNAATSLTFTPQAPQPAKPDQGDQDEPSRNLPAKPPPISRSPSRPPIKARRHDDAAAASGSGMMIVLLLLLGFGFLSCVGCGGAMGFWFYSADAVVEHKDRPIAFNNKLDVVVKVDGFKADKPAFDFNREKKDKDKDNDGFLFDANRDKDKDRPPFDADRNKDKDRLPPFDKVRDNKDDRAPFDGNKDTDRPPFDDLKEKKPVQTGVIPVVFGPDGTYASINRIDVTDGRTPLIGFGNRRHKLYSVQMEAGQFYQIDMMASYQFDAYLCLLQNNRVVRDDDDSAGQHNPRIMFQPTQSGQYYIAATSLGGGQSIGPFTLVVRRSVTDIVVDPKAKGFNINPKKKKRS